jgi:hypothetical protein
VLALSKEQCRNVERALTDQREIHRHEHSFSIVCIATAQLLCGEPAQCGPGRFRHPQQAAGRPFGHGADSSGGEAWSQHRPLIGSEVCPFRGLLHLRLHVCSPSRRLRWWSESQPVFAAVTLDPPQGLRPLHCAIEGEGSRIRGGAVLESGLSDAGPRSIGQKVRITINWAEGTAAGTRDGRESVGDAWISRHHSVARHDASHPS